jgi:hypothetical protein
LRKLGFGVIAIVGINLNEVEIGDVAVKLIHNGFCIRA